MLCPRQLLQGKKRQLGRKQVWDNYDMVVRPVDKRENYIKRCVAVPGDKLEVVDGQVFINGNPQEKIENMQYKYRVKTNGYTLRPKTLQNLGISHEDILGSRLIDSNNEFEFPLIKDNVEKIKNFKAVVDIEQRIAPKNKRAEYIFPHQPQYNWNEDNFGPLLIPKKGETVNLTIENLPIYERIIHLYEHNDIEVQGDKILINGEATNSYTFNMDYYFMMGDSRHNSADSRFWGFVPEDHVVGKAVFIWLSLDKDKSLFDGKIRWSRMFSLIH